MGRVVLTVTILMEVLDHCVAKRRGTQRRALHPQTILEIVKQVLWCIIKTNHEGT